MGDVVEAKCQKQGSPEIHAWFEAMIVNYNSTTNQYTVQFKGYIVVYSKGDIALTNFRYESALNETLPANCVRFLSMMIGNGVLYMLVVSSSIFIYLLSLICTSTCSC